MKFFYIILALVNNSKYYFNFNIILNHIISAYVYGDPELNSGGQSVSKYCEDGKNSANIFFGQRKYQSGKF